MYKFNVDVDVDVDEQTSIEQKWFSECMVGGDSRGKKRRARADGFGFKVRETNAILEDTVMTINLYALARLRKLQAKSSK